MDGMNEIFHDVEAFLSDFYSSVINFQKSLMSKLNIYETTVFINDYLSSDTIENTVTAIKKINVKRDKVTIETYNPPLVISEIYNDLRKVSDFNSAKQGHTSKGTSYLSCGIRFKNNLIGILICEQNHKRYRWSIDEITPIIEHACEMNDPIMKLATLINIRSKEQRQQFILDNIKDVILIYDRVGRIKFISSNIENYSDYKAEDLIGIIGTSVMHPEQFEQIYYYLDRLAKGHNDAPHDYLMRQKSGEYHWWSYSCKPIMKDGQLDEVISIIRNVDQEKRNQLKLEENENKFRMLAENASDIIFILDQQFNLTYLSPSIERIRGYSVEETLSQGLEDIFETESHQYLKEFFQAHVDPKFNINRKSPRKVTMNLQVKHKNGNKIWTETTLTSMVNSEGIFSGVHGITRDITDRKLAEDKLRESEERYRFILDNIDDVILVYNKEGAITFIASNGHLQELGYSYEEMIGMNALHLIHPDHHEEVMKNLGELSRGIIHDPHEYRIRSKSGEYLWYRLNCHPIINNGEMAEVVCVASNIDKQIKIIQKIEDSEKKYRMLAENASDIIFTLDMNFNFDYISPSVTRVRGYTVEEAMKQSIKEAITPESYQRVQEVFAVEIENENKGIAQPDRQVTIELEEYCKDGNTIWTETSFSALRDPDGIMNGLIGITRNITDKKRILQRQQAFMDTIKDIIIIYDMHTKILDVSQNVDNIPGFSREYLIGKTSFDLLHPDHMSRAAYYFDRLKKGISDDSHEYMVKNMIGEYIWIRMRCNPIIKNGKLTEVISAATDISREIEEKEKLVNNIEKYRTITEGMQDMIITFDLETLSPVYVSSTCARLLGRTQEEMIHILALTDPEKGEGLFPRDSISVIQKFINDKIKNNPDGIDYDSQTLLDLEIYRKDGTLVKIETSVSFIDSGKSKQVLTLSRNISKRKEITVTGQDSAHVTPLKKTRKSKISSVS